MLQVKYFAASIPKHGNSNDENEDALSRILISDYRDGSIKSLHCAISDGATTATFSKLWANILVESTEGVKKIPSESLVKQIIAEGGKKWLAKINEKDLPWYAQEKAKKGSFATLLWLAINKRKNKTHSNLTALSVGDSELIHIRNGKVLTAFPYEYSEEFSSYTSLISTKIEKNKTLNYKMKKMRIQHTDHIIISTDAVANYFLRQFEQDINPLDELTRLINLEMNQEKKNSLFGNWIDSLREKHEIKNDDSSLIWLQFYDLNS